ncbi:GNAT family N-acetyltransferase [Brachybacterium huguangmaarense]
MLRLVVPDPARYDDWSALLAAFGDGPKDGSGYYDGAVNTTREEFAAYLAQRAREEDLALEPAPGRVHAAYRWIEEDGALVGFIALRLGLTPFLYDLGGHIGYSVAPHARRRGIATGALGRMVAEARTRGIDPVLVTCLETNEGSRRAIEANGGVYDGSIDGRRRYWIGAGERPARPEEQPAG